MATPFFPTFIFPWDTEHEGSEAFLTPEYIFVLPFMHSSQMSGQFFEG